MGPARFGRRNLMNLEGGRSKARCGRREVRVRKANGKRDLADRWRTADQKGRPSGVGVTAPRQTGGV